MKRSGLRCISVVYSIVFFGVIVIFFGAVRDVQAQSAGSHVYAGIVSIIPEFPKVGQITQLIVSYQTQDTRIKERIYSYKNSDSVVFDQVSLERAAGAVIFVKITMRLRHSGIITIPFIVENGTYLVHVPNITAENSIDNKSKLMLLPHPVFPFISFLYMLIVVCAGLFFLKTSINVVLVMVPLSGKLLYWIQNLLNAHRASCIVKKMMHELADMEKPKFTGSSISTMQSYACLYKALQIRFGFLYGSVFNTLTMDEMQQQLLETFNHAIQTRAHFSDIKYSLSAKVPVLLQTAAEQRSRLGENVRDFFFTLKEVLYGGKVYDLRIRKDHCVTVLQLFSACRSRGLDAQNYVVSSDDVKAAER